MVKNAPQLRISLDYCNEIKGPVFKIRNDPRITKIGRYLRRSSIDELPQLINILKGDMSLVGPRPPIPDEVNCYRIEDRRRLSMRPGLTCLWQVNGRINIPFDRWMEMDRSYIDHWSLWLDFKILFKTIFVVIKGEGAT
jgi:lipopolysaccharide/colanic/teichoic acid biosynthesis glycosyltransferase